VQHFPYGRLHAAGAAGARDGSRFKRSRHLRGLFPAVIFFTRRRKGAAVCAAMSPAGLAKVRAHCILLRPVGDEAFSEGAKASAVKESAPSRTEPVDLAQRGSTPNYR